jgi:hypothetical protein
MTIPSEAAVAQKVAAERDVPGDGLACRRALQIDGLGCSEHGTSGRCDFFTGRVWTTLGGTLLVVILLLIVLAVLGRSVPAWHDAMVNFFNALTYIFTGSGSVTTG